jgi:hypothetical protein
MFGALRTVEKGRGSTRRLTVCATMALAAMLIALSASALLQWQSTRHIVDAGFRFDGVTFDFPLLVDRLGGGLTEDEKHRIESIAWSELRSAYHGLRLVFTRDSGVFYRVRVVQRFPGRGFRSRAAAESLTMGPLGGQGSVSFEMLATLAIRHAAADAARDTIVDGIGRGIGRAVAHEFAHQLLPSVNIHTTQDRASYEYRSADRAAQYYGTMQWDLAWPLLVDRIGPSAATGH